MVTGLLIFGGLLVALGYLLMKKGAMEMEEEVKEAEILERGEPMKSGDPMPEELRRLFGQPLLREGPAGILATKLRGVRERVVFEEEKKTLESQAEWYSSRAKTREAQLKDLEAQERLIQKMIASGALSREAIEYLERHFPGFKKKAEQAERKADLQAEVDMLELQKKKANLQKDIRKIQSEDGSEFYREMWRKETKKLIADLEGRHNLREALFTKIKELAERMAQDGRSEEEIELLKEELKEDAKEILLDLEEEIEQMRGEKGRHGRR